MLSGNTSKAGDDGGSPDESFLFLLTVWVAPGIESLGDRGQSRMGKRLNLRAVRHARDAP